MFTLIRNRTLAVADLIAKNLMVSPKLDNRFFIDPHFQT
jgi:hypothetical protein